MATFIPDSYTRAEAALNEVTEDASTIVAQHERAVEQLVDLHSRLTKMSQTAPNGWAGLIGFINDQVAANPGDAAWLVLKGRADKIVADFQARKAQYQAINAAIAAV